MPLLKDQSFVYHPYNHGHCAPVQVVPFALGMFVLVEGLSVQGW